MKKYILISTLLIITHSIVAQKVPVFQWQDHLSYRSGVSVAEGGGKVYCTTKSGIFTFNKGDNSMDRLSKVNGLSDVEGKVVNYNHNNNKAIIAYSNSNIDIIDKGGVINIPDIKNKNIVGNKAINSIYILNQFAYLACGFGIVVLDMDKLEVNDTYYIGAGGNPINVRDITSDSAYIYAATDGGIYQASITNPNLADYNSWTKMPGLPNGIYNTITAFDGKIYTNLSRYLASTLTTTYYDQDTIYVYDYVTSTWSYYIDPLGTNHSGYITNSLKTNYNTLVWAHDNAAISNGQFGGYFPVSFNDSQGNPIAGNAQDAVVDNNGDIWIADGVFGLVSWRHGIGFEYRYPNGPASESINSMFAAGGNLLVAPGAVSSEWTGASKIAEVYSYNNQNWNTISGIYPSVNMNNSRDVLNVLVDTNDVNHAYAACWGYGLIELYNGVPIKQYDTTNSSLQATNHSGNIYTDGLALDASGNLWVTNSLIKKSISVKTPGGSWTALDFSPVLGNGPYLGNILVDRNDQKWVMLSRGVGIMVYAAGSPVPSASNTKLMTTATGSGALPSTDVFAMVEDMNGEIWVGTDKGIAVFYSPENVFTTQNYDSQQILLEQDGQAQILLLTETVQAIAVDDANRKWIGTENSGVFLMSADGTQQIYHFTAENSPLFSDNIVSIAIDHKTGEVYFGTDKGLIEFRGSATASSSNFGDLYAFPNPVKPDYTGPIAIKGLTNNATVKITDVSGALVYQTISEGGQALWYGKNFKGEKVSSGVYMVFCTNEDGSLKGVTKVLFIN